MDWYSRFKADFFGYWSAAGLPAPRGYETLYLTALRRTSFTPPPAFPKAASKPLDPALVNAVYGFGALFGRHCAVLIGASSTTVDERADWCGRFNLGISLLDYLCDQGDGSRGVATLPAFVALGKHGAPRRSAGLLTDGERFLNELAGGLLSRVEDAIGPPESRGLWHSLRGMLDAELTVSNQTLAEMPSAAAATRVLRLKSREPFAVMAEWMTHTSCRGGPWHSSGSARMLGRALGACYWLFDDAKDLWLDFAAGRWNYFLVHAVEGNRLLATQPRDAIVDVALTRALDASRVAPRSAREAVRGVVRALSGMGGGRRTREEALGGVAVSLARL